MAPLSATLTDAFAQIDARELERLTRMELPSFESLCPSDLARLARMIHSRFAGGGSYQDAEDAVQLAVENILRKARQGRVDLEEINSVAGLIYGYAKWHMLTIVSRRARRDRWLSSDRLQEESHCEPSINPDLGARLLLEHTAAEIDRLLKTTHTLTQDISEMTGVRRALIERRRMHLGIRRSTLRFWSDDQILEAFQRFFAEHGRAPKANHEPLSLAYFPSATVVKVAFGGWRAATEAAGLPVNTKSLGIDRVARKIYTWFERNGRWPSTRDCESTADLPSTTAVKAYFGTASPRKAAPAIEAALGLAG